MNIKDKKILKLISLRFKEDDSFDCFESIISYFVGCDVMQDQWHKNKARRMMKKLLPEDMRRELQPKCKCHAKH